MSALGGARAVLRPSASSTAAVGFAYDQGDALADSSAAPARRVGLGWHSAAVNSLTAAGWELFDNAVAWAAGGTRHSYDAAGNQTATSDGAQAFGYDTADRTTAMRTSRDGATLSAGYAGDGQYERHTAGAATYTTTILGVTAETAGSSSVGYTRDSLGGLVGLRDGADRGYYLFDGLGSVAAVADDTGAVVNTYSYTPYGQTTEAAAAGAFDNPWRYTGQYQDDVTGQYKMGHRYYQPGLARWTQADPSGLEANSYLYAGANPVNNVDPSGLHHTNWGDGECSWATESIPGVFDFHAACTAHDQCLELGGSFDYCDAMFLQDMQVSCIVMHGSGGIGLGQCFSWAAEYFTIVSIFPFRS